jgi:tape measure domain-containing protein
VELLPGYFLLNYKGVEMAIEVDVKSNSRFARQDLDQLEAQVNKVGKSVNKLSEKDFKSLSASVSSIDSSIKSLGSKLSNLAAGVGTLVAATAGLSALAKAADSFAKMSNRIKTTTNTVDEYNRSLSDTRKIALETGQSIEDITALYSKLTFASKDFAATQGQVAKVTATVSKALAASGASAAERSSAILQLGQAMQSAFVQGDELRTLREAAPFLIKTVADSLGVTVGEIKKLGEQGMLTSKVFFNALLEGADETDRVFQKMDATYEKAFKTFGTGLQIFARQFLNAFGGGDFAEVLNRFAKDFTKAAINFDMTLIRMKADFWLFINSLVKGFPSASKVVKDEVKKIVEYVKGIKIPSIDLDKFIPKLEPMKQSVLSWVKTIERAFFWLYDEVIGHSWIPDLVEGVIWWMKKLLDKPVEYAKVFAHKVNNFFANIKLPELQVKEFGLASGITIATLAGLATAFATKSVFLPLSVGVGTALVLGFNKEATALTSIVGTVFSGGIALLVGNPVIKVMAGVVSTMFTAAAIESKGAVTQSFGDAVLSGIRWAFDKIVNYLYGQDVFGQRAFQDTLFLVAKIALLFSAGRSAFVSAAQGLVGAGNAFGKKMGDRLEKSLRSMDLKGMQNKLSNEQAMLKRNTEAARMAVNAERKVLAQTRSANGQLLGNMGLKQYDIAARSNNPQAMAAFVNSLSAEGQKAVKRLNLNNQRMDTVLRDNELRQSKVIKPLEEAVRNNKMVVDSLSASLRQASLALQGAIGNLAGGVAGIFGSFAGYNVGRNIADGMAENTPAWQKAAIPFVGAFVGQFLASGIGQIVGRFTYLFIATAVPGIVKAFLAGVALPLARTFMTYGIVGPLSQLLPKIFAVSLAPVTAIPIAVVGLTVLLGAFGPTIIKSMKTGANYLVERMQNILFDMLPTKLQDTLRKNFEASGEAGPIQPENSRSLTLRVAEVAISIVDMFDSESAHDISEYGRGGEEETSQIRKIAEWVDKIPETFADAMAMRGGMIVSPSPEELGKSVAKGAEAALTAVSGTAMAANDPAWTEQQIRIAEKIRQEAERQGAGEYKELLVSLAKRESSLDPLAKNPKSTATGVFQFIKDTAKQYGINPLNEDQNIGAGVKMFKENLSRFGDPYTALAAHHVGPGEAKEAMVPGSSVGDINVKTSQWLKDIIEDVSTRTDGPVKESIQSKLSSAFESVESIMQELRSAYEEGGAGGVLNAIKKIVSPIFEKLTSFIGLDPKEISKSIEESLPKDDPFNKPQTEFMKSLNAAGSAEELLATINERLEKIGAVKINNLDFIKNDDFENFFINLEKLDEVFADLADPRTPLFMRKRLEKTAEELEEGLKKIAAAAALDNKKPGEEGGWQPSAAAIEDGQTAAQNFTNQFAAGFSSFLKGQTSFKELGQNLLFEITGQIVDAFAQNFVKSFMDSSNLGNKISDMFASIFHLGDVAGGGLGKQTINATTAIINAGSIMGGGSGAGSFMSSGGISGMFGPKGKGSTSVTGAAGEMVGGSVMTPGFGDGLFDLTLTEIGKVDVAGSSAFTSVADVATSSFKGLGETIGGIFEGLGSSISGIFSSLLGGGGGGGGGFLSGFMGLFGFANGGLIRGPGTGTSDSILAAVSSGEYIVKSSQTKKYLPLLQAINEGKLPAFATGGIVGDLPALKSENKLASKKESQVFNISITGDISRQTKREIYTMLPEIANGVNSYNREVGYRG